MSGTKCLSFYTEIIHYVYSQSDCGTFFLFKFTVDYALQFSLYFPVVHEYFVCVFTCTWLFAFLHVHINDCFAEHWSKILFQSLSGVGETIQDRAQITNNSALEAALNTQFLFQIGIFSAVPMILGFILEQGFLRVIGYPACISIYFLINAHDMNY